MNDGIIQHEGLRRLAWLTVLVIFSAFGRLVASVPPAAQALLDERSAAIGRVHEEFDKQKADLFDKYAAALEREVANYRQGGDLQNLLAVTKEQESAREQRETTDADAPVLAPYRKTLGETLSKYELTVESTVKGIDANTVTSLSALRTQLTQAGNVEAAVAVDEQIKAIEGAVEGGKPEASSLLVVDGKVPDASLFKSEDPWVGNFTLEPKRYLLRERMVLGRQGKKEEPQRSYPGKVLSPKGCRFEKGEIFIDEGFLKAEGTHFKDMALRVDLGGEFEARDSLFEETSVGKGGAWFVDYFSSKWVFDNCVFTGSFVREWKVGNVGVKVNNCTFYGVEFSGIGYREDAGDEVKRPWMQITNCLFVNCKIPESFLLATRDCMFVDCEFLETDGEMKIKTPIKTRIFVNHRKSLPTTGPMRTVEVVELPQGRANVGAFLKHTRTGKSLSF
ncbi:hypothetical protein FEM03_02250 [Phragmitibacter flavus]|uniref:Right-handed parallel beta-helix repeat-containing protein n=1 Tax=Phragmitibacter flavus TaxID=2576071 RepID=A0A5R8KIQ1_9BACT|nr:hypothetical protein [Phragmitibacter flavus]TLD72198.1 hypothetical protein FEM03_02250 [Phragmitibacter flavus]